MTNTRVTLGPGLEVNIDFDLQKSTCKGCGMNIYWATTDKGKSMPIVIHSHFVDCPEANKFRKKDKEK